MTHQSTLLQQARNSSTSGMKPVSTPACRKRRSIMYPERPLQIMDSPPRLLRCATREFPDNGKAVKACGRKQRLVLWSHQRNLCPAQTASSTTYKSIHHAMPTGILCQAMTKYVSV